MVGTHFQAITKYRQYLRWLGGSEGLFDRAPRINYSTFGWHPYCLHYKLPY